jgi:hypothetical protein
MNIPNDRETYLAIDDPLPAIFEAVNPTFKTQETQRVNADREARTLYTSFREIWKDRVLFFADGVFGAGQFKIKGQTNLRDRQSVKFPPVRRKGLKASLQHFRRQSEGLEWRLQPLRTKPLSVEKA